MMFAICEDEVYFALRLKKLVREYARLRGIDLSIQTFSSGEALIQACKRFDVILMDIRLPGDDGLTVMRRLRSSGDQGQLIFITAYQEYAVRAFELDTVHYLLKPVSAGNLFPALDRAAKRAAMEDGKFFLLSKGSTVAKIRMREILYCEAFDHQITIHTLTGGSQFFGTLDAVRHELDERFFRCHRSYLVNMDFVMRLENGSAVLEGGGKVLVSRRKQREFMRRLLQSCRKGLG